VREPVSGNAVNLNPVSNGTSFRPLLAIRRLLRYTRLSVDLTRPSRVPVRLDPGGFR
jgi:hypothetical protein